MVQSLYGTEFRMVQSVVWYRVSYGTECRMVQSVVWYRVSYGTECRMVQSVVWYRVSYGNAQLASNYDAKCVELRRLFKIFKKLLLLMIEGFVKRPIANPQISPQGLICKN